MKYHREADIPDARLTLQVLGIILLFVIAAAFVVLIAGCTNGAPDCDRVTSTVNTKAVQCNAHFEVRGDCDAANYVEGDVDACLAAVAAATCDGLRQVVRGQCLGLFGHAGL